MSNERERGAAAIPSDWPSVGPIDLAVHDLPHASSSVEWWYVNAHVETDAGQRLSVFASFFVVTVSDEDAARTGSQHRHFVTWAVIDPERKRYVAEALLDPKTPSDGIERLDRGEGSTDGRIRRAMREMFERGGVPQPDRLLRTSSVARDRLAIAMDSQRFSKLPDGRYRLELVSADGATGATLDFSLEKPVIRHGDDGVVAGFTVKRMFYYFVPRCGVTGTVRVDGREQRVVSGRGWYDHEFGEHASGAAGKEQSVAWNWISAQLDDGTDVSAYETFDEGDGNKPLERRVVVIAADGARSVFDDFTLEASEPWTSTRTFNAYPTRWKLTVPQAALEIDARAAFVAQEFCTLLSPPAFWEGRMDIRAKRGGVAVDGVGFVERSGMQEATTLDRFFTAVGREARRAVDQLIPARLSNDDLVRLFASERHADHMDGVDPEQLSTVLTRPIRDIALRGGKAWRSFALLASLDMVGGDSEKHRHWLAFPELLHSGSLILDDVQDRSELRRGGPSLHRMIGEPLAINAGSACAYLALLVGLKDEMTADVRVRVHEEFFQALRAAHAGQALDIAGLHHLMPVVVESGAGALLEERVRAIHRLKSAIPPAALARAAVHIAGGTRAQEVALDQLFDAFGVAFQGMDDVLNLRGFEGNLKDRGEDVAEGKVTAPVAKAMSRLDLAGRRELWSILDAAPRERAKIDRAIALMESCGAIDAVEQEARSLIETTWQRVAPVFDDTLSKLMIRAFGWYILERHY